MPSKFSLNIDSEPHALRPLGLRARWWSALEFLIGGAVVIGHNVLRVLPNEVPILVVMALVSMRLRSGPWDWSWRGDWSALGFRRPDSWTRVLLIAIAAAGLRLLLGAYVIDPVTSHFWPPARAPSAAGEVAGHLGTALMYLPVIWVFAAFGEEIGYRGYLMGRAAEWGGGSVAACWAAVIVTSVLFGFGHFYKGPAGILDSAVAGLILGAAYIVAGRNLWAAILAHGLIDTVSLTLLYFGAAG